MEGDFRLGCWVVQPRMNAITSGETSRRLEPKMMRVLVHLAEHAGEVVTKDEIMAAVWPDIYVTEDVLMRCVSELRRALGDDARDPRYIQTIHKSGYRLIAPVQPDRGSGSAGTDLSGVREPGSEQAIRMKGARSRPIGIAAGGVILVAAAVFAVWHWYRSQAPPHPEHLVLAVLPFENLSGDPEQDFISEGLTEEMIAGLSNLQPDRLRVIARTSAMRYENARKGIDQIGLELGANYVLEGSVRREKDRVRVTVQLIRVSDQTHVWAESFDREISGILTLQAEVARLVADRIRITLTPGAVHRLAAARPVNPEAYVEYLKGRRQWHKMTVAGFQRAGEHYRRAIELDRQYAAAWLGLADSYRMRGSWWGDLQARDAFPLAKRMLEQVMKLDDSLGEAYASLGWIRFAYEWDWSGAERAFKRGIELAPNSRDAHSYYANFLRCMGRLQEARVQIERSLEIEPLSPLELVEASILYADLGLPDKARQSLEGALELDPESPPVVWRKAGADADTGRLEQAIQYLEAKGATTQPHMLTSGILARLYILDDRESKARAILKEMMKPVHSSPMEVSILCRRLGDEAGALEWLERAVAERDPSVVWLSRASAETMGPMWNSPRFQAIFRQLNFPPKPSSPAR